MTRTNSISVADLAQALGVGFAGEDRMLTGIAPLKTARADQLSFLSNTRYSKDLTDSSAGAVLLSLDEAYSGSAAVIRVADPYLALAQASRYFSKRAEIQPGIAASATIEPSATVADTAQICAGAYIGAGVTVGDSVYIGPNAVIGAQSLIEAGTRIEANVTLYPEVQIGKDCLIHSGAVLGADGFGFAHSANGWVKIEQLGRVVVGDNVEIGANTTIDRGALDDTIIEAGVKLDNQIQIGHNVVIGADTAIAGACAIAGSARIGKRCTIAGMSGVAGHIEIADGTHLTGMSMVTRSIETPGAYSSGTGIQPYAQWKKNVVRFRNLDALSRKVKELESRVEQISVKENT